MMRRSRSSVSFRVLPAAWLIALALVRVVVRPFVAPSSAPMRSRPGSRASSSIGTSLHDSVALRAEVAQQERVTTSPAAWVLPSVDKDTDSFHKGVGADYAWVQTSTTLYLFAPVPADGPPQVRVTLEDEGTVIGFSVGGVDIVKGNLRNAAKPGEQIWMIEDAPDGQTFVVAEFEKQIPGREWTSVLQPDVTLSEGYDMPKVTTLTVSEDQLAATVDATMEHLRRKHGVMKIAPEGHEATQGDVLTVDMQGFELAPGGGRGAALDGVASAEGQSIELGSAGGFPAQVHDQLVGITVGTTRDVEVTLGRRAGSFGGQRVLIAMTCHEIQQQELPELTDDFARGVKQAELFAQAGTAAGIPEYEVQDPTTFTLDALREEIRGEVSQQAMMTHDDDRQTQLKAWLLNNGDVSCEWADMSTDEAMRDEKLAAIARAVAERNGLMSMIDLEEIKKETWDVLGTPKEGEAMAEVGSDPDREFQETYEKVFRKCVMDSVLGWLSERVEVITSAGS